MLDKNSEQPYLTTVNLSYLWQQNLPGSVIMKAKKKKLQRVLSCGGGFSFKDKDKIIGNQISRPWSVTFLDNKTVLNTCTSGDLVKSELNISPDKMKVRVVNKTPHQNGVSRRVKVTRNHSNR